MPHTIINLHVHFAAVTSTTTTVTATTATPVVTSPVPILPSNSGTLILLTNIKAHLHIFQNLLKLQLLPHQLLH